MNALRKYGKGALVGLVVWATWELGAYYGSPVDNFLPYLIVLVVAVLIITVIRADDIREGRNE